MLGQGGALAAATQAAAAAADAAAEAALGAADADGGGVAEVDEFGRSVGRAKRQQAQEALERREGLVQEQQRRLQAAAAGAWRGHRRASGEAGGVPAGLRGE